MEYFPAQVSGSLCSLELTSGEGRWASQETQACVKGQPAGVKWPQCNAGWLCSPGYVPVSAQLGHQPMVPVLFHGCRLQDQVTPTENINTNT